MSDNARIFSSEHDGQQWLVNCSVKVGENTHGGLHFVQLPATATPEEIEAALIAQYTPQG